MRARILFSIFLTLAISVSTAHASPHVDALKSTAQYTITDNRLLYCYQTLSPDFVIPGFDIPAGDIRAGSYTLYAPTTKCLDLGFGVYTGYLLGTQLNTRVYAVTTPSALAICARGIIENCAVVQTNPADTVTAISQVTDRCYETYPRADIALLPPQDQFQILAGGVSCLSLGKTLLVGYLANSRQRVPVYSASESVAIRLCETGAVNPCSFVSNDAAQKARILVSEFFNPTLNRYFRTADPSETAYLRATPAAGENSTGDNFFGYSVATNGARGVCRFYGSVSPGPNSHFFTLDPQECAALRAAEATTPATQKRWNYEGVSFYALAPETGGACPPLAPNKVYRAYNRGNETGKDSNHRFTANQSTYESMIANGWKGEGVVMCVP